MALNPSIKHVLPVSPAVAAATYDYFDIAEGTGIKNFYAAQADTSGAAVVPFLTTDITTYSNKTVEKAATGSTAWGLRSTASYANVFNLSKLVKGKAYLSITQGVTAGGAVTGQVMLKTWLYHVDAASTPTLMASGNTELSDAATGVAGNTTDTRTIPYDLTSKRWHFKAGEGMRLLVELWGVGGADTVTVGYGIDPQDRNDKVTELPVCIADVDTTQLKLAVPFILDI